MKNYADLGGCYPPQPSASADNTLLDLHNSSYHTQPHPIIANYTEEIVSCSRGKQGGIWEGHRKGGGLSSFFLHPSPRLNYLSLCMPTMLAI